MVLYLQKNRELLWDIVTGTGQVAVALGAGWPGLAIVAGGTLMGIIGSVRENLGVE